MKKSLETYLMILVNQHILKIKTRRGNVAMNWQQEALRYYLANLDNRMSKNEQLIR